MSRKFTPEQALIDRLLSDDALAFEELSRRYCYSLYSYCMSKLHSEEDARRIVRNLFISLWEDRYAIPADFSLSLHLYTEVRKAVVQCINAKLNHNKDLPNIEEEIIPGFSAIQLQKAKYPVRNADRIKSRFPLSEVKRQGYEELWWSRYSPSINLKGLRHAFQSVLNLW